MTHCISLFSNPSWWRHVLINKCPPPPQLRQSTHSENFTDLGNCSLTFCEGGGVNLKQVSKISWRFQSFFVLFLKSFENRHICCCFSCSLYTWLWQSRLRSFSNFFKEINFKKIITKIKKLAMLLYCYWRWPKKLNLLHFHSLITSGSQFGYFFQGKAKFSSEEGKNIRFA